MKGLAVGDLLLPTSKMVYLYEVEGVKEHVDQVLTTEFKNKDRADIRTTWRSS